jgi:hemerythrin-like metal-binding protein
MVAIEWSKKYSVGVEMFDEQHKVFFGIINDLYASIMERKEREVLGDIFEQLLKYTDFHFESEERYFDEFHYEHAVEHKEAHRLLTERLLALKTRWDEGALDNPYELLDFLEDWLVEHIMGMDRQYHECFHAHGLK